MLIRKAASIKSSEITSQLNYLNRRRFMAAAGVAGALALGGDRLLRLASPEPVAAATKMNTVKSPLSTTGVTPTAYNDITSYNNYYEFGTGKGDPARNATHLKTYPWNVSVEGLVKSKKTFSIDQLVKLRPQEERVYRFRCVEGWSMVVPWVGYSLSEFIKQCEPLPSAKYVQFLSLADPAQMP